MANDVPKATVPEIERALDEGKATETQIRAWALQLDGAYNAATAAKDKASAERIATMLQRLRTAKPRAVDTLNLKSAPVQPVVSETPAPGPQEGTNVHGVGVDDVGETPAEPVSEPEHFEASPDPDVEGDEEGDEEEDGGFETDSPGASRHAVEEAERLGVDLALVPYDGDRVLKSDVVAYARQRGIYSK